MHHDFKLRQDAETLENEEIAADLKDHYQQKRNKLKHEYGKLGFQLTEQSTDKEILPITNPDDLLQKHREEADELAERRKAEYEHAERLREDKRKRDAEEEDARKKQREADDAEAKKYAAPKIGGGLFSYFTSSKSPTDTSAAPANPLDTDEYKDAEEEPSTVTYAVFLKHESTLRRFKSSSFAYGQSCSTNHLEHLQFFKCKPTFGTEEVLTWLVRGKFPC